MNEEKTYYEVLEVEEAASSGEIKQAYRNLVKIWHPDLNPGKKNTEEKTREIIDAYAVLSDPEKRAQYDEYLSLIRSFKPAAEKEAEEEVYDPGFSDMTFEEYAGKVSKGVYSAWNDSFDEEDSVFDEEGYKQYVKNKKNVMGREVRNPGFILIGFAITMVGSILYMNRNTLFHGKGSSILSASPLLLAFIGIVGVIFELVRRGKASRKEREKILGGIESTIEADRWFEYWLYPEMPLSECRKVFFEFSVRVDKYLLSRFNSMSEEEKKEYADIIELLEECILFREKKR